MVNGVLERKTWEGSKAVGKIPLLAERGVRKVGAFNEADEKAEKTKGNRRRSGSMREPSKFLQPPSRKSFKLIKEGIGKRRCCKEGTLRSRTGESL